MRKLVRGSSLLLILSLAWSAVASDDQQKAQKILKQITAMATDTTGRRAVSEAVSYTAAVTRQELTSCRRALGLNYGEALPRLRTREGRLEDGRYQRSVEEWSEHLADREPASGELEASGERR